MPSTACTALCSSYQMAYKRQTKNVSICLPDLAAVVWWSRNAAYMRIVLALALRSAITHLVYHPLPLHAALVLKQAGHHVDADMLPVAIRVRHLYLVCLQRFLDLLLSMQTSGCGASWAWSRFTFACKHPHVRTR